MNLRQLYNHAARYSPEALNMKLHTENDDEEVSGFEFRWLSEDGDILDDEEKNEVIEEYGDDWNSESEYYRSSQTPMQYAESFKKVLVLT